MRQITCGSSSLHKCPKVFPDFHGSREIPTFEQSLNTLHRCFVCPYLSLTPTLTYFRCAGHKRAPMCSFVPTSIPPQHGVNTQDTSEHTGACSCLVYPYLSFFGCPEHRRAHWCLPVSLFLSFRHHTDAQYMSEHTMLTRVLCVLISVSLDAQNTGEHQSACPCPGHL